MENFVPVNQQRVLAFEFVLKNLLAWNKELTGSEENDLSTLKAIKLLFFVTAVNTKGGGKNLLLNGTFHDFVAMPYGHVESVIYDEIRKNNGELKYYRINNACTSRKLENDIDNLDTEIFGDVRNEIVDSIATLKVVNPVLITMSAFDLVELSHSWYSWKKTFSKAKSQGIGSLEINPDYIINEDKIFSLQNF